MLLFPIWYPMVEEDGLRWPRVADLPLYAFMIFIGLLSIWLSHHKG